MSISECGVSKGHDTGYHPPGAQVGNKFGELAVAGVHRMEYPIAIVLGEEAEREGREEKEEGEKETEERREGEKEMEERREGERGRKLNLLNH